MGNKIGRRRQVVDERYTRPQGFYHHRDIDYKKLRKLILEFKLAPCYPGEEEPALDLEECPICFMYYPSLNRSRCCMKGICTECYLRMKPQIYAWPTQCPFCKFSNYAVEYRGVRTKEEKGLEELEEQKVIEAQIRRRQQELQDEEESTLKGNERTSLSRTVMPTGTEYMDIPSCSLSESSLRNSTQWDKSIYPQGASSMMSSKRRSHSRQNREDNFDLDFEEIMLMEAIWLSVQEQGLHQTLCEGGSISPPPSGYYYDPAESSSGGFACTVAAMAERSYHPESWAEASSESTRLAVLREGEWAPDYGSEVAEAGTSYAGSDVTMDVGSAALPSIPNWVNFFAGPESFEEQMILAMAASRADIRARAVGVAWP